MGSKKAGLPYLGVRVFTVTGVVIKIGISGFASVENFIAQDLSEWLRRVSRKRIFWFENTTVQLHRPDFPVRSNRAQEVFAIRT